MAFVQLVGLNLTILILYTMYSLSFCPLMYSKGLRSFLFSSTRLKFLPISRNAFHVLLQVGLGRLFVCFLGLGFRFCFVLVGINSRDYIFLLSSRFEDEKSSSELFHRNILNQFLV